MARCPPSRRLAPHSRPGSRRRCGIESVVDAAATAARLVGLAEGKTQLFAAQANVFPVGMRLRWRDAVFFRDVLGDVLAFRRHLRIELERLEVQLGGNVARHPLQRVVQRFKTNEAPRACNVGDEIYVERNGHGGMGLNSTFSEEGIHQL